MNMRNFFLTLVSLFVAMPVFAAINDLDNNDLASQSASVFKVDSNNNYESNLKLRDARKVGVGLGVGGSLGLLGFNLEMNFEDINGAIAGFGGGEGYSSVHVLWKHVFEGDTIAPYTTLGYSRWYNSSGGPDSYKKSPILERALTEEEKETGRFATNFISGSVGLQYTQLRGDMAGVSLFAEIVMLVEARNVALIPTGTLGVAYYF